MLDIIYSQSTIMQLLLVREGWWVLKRYAPMKVMLDRCIVANVIRGLKALSLGENRVRFAATRSVRDQEVISTPHRQSRLLTRLL